MKPQNTALWMPKLGGRFEVGPALYTTPESNEIVVHVRAIAMNPVDSMSGIVYRVILPWLKYPMVFGSDVAGEVIEVGADVTRFKPGDRIVGQAFGCDPSRNRAAEGAFQHYTVLMQHMVSHIPDNLSFEQAAVLPMTLSVAATGLFQQDHLGLAMPTLSSSDRGEIVLVWGGSTSVGCNAIQLADCAGYRVIATSSPHNFDFLKSLGTEEVVDYHDRNAANKLVEIIRDNPLAGSLAITNGSLSPILSIRAYKDSFSIGS